MALRLQPDTLALTIGFLLADPSVSAIAGNRVSNRIVAGSPSVYVSTITGREIVRTHLDEQIVQVDAFAADLGTSSLLARTIRAVMLEMPTADLTRGVVTHVRTVTPPRPLPTTTEDTRHRLSGEYGIFVHPHPL